MFRPWATDEGPPSHSVPPHLIAKAAARIGPEAFEDIHERLLKAYFTENRDITSEKVLGDIWGEAGLDPEGMKEAEDPELVKEVFLQHNEAVEHGASGVPAVRVEGHFGIIIGAEPEENYLRLVRAAQAK